MTTRKIIRLSGHPEGFGQTPDELTKVMFESELPVQHSHEYYTDDDLGLYVGVWDTTGMIETAGPYACDEFMWLLEGEAEIRNCSTGEVEKARAGEPFVIPRGYDCQWHQRGYLRKFYVISENPNESPPEKPTVEGIIIPDAHAPLKPLPTAQPFLTDGVSPVQHQHVFYQNGSGDFLAGTWESEPFESLNMPFPYNQFACVIEGSLTLVDEEGSDHYFQSGDALFVPEGVICGARTTEKVKFFFAAIKSTRAN